MKHRKVIFFILSLVFSLVLTVLFTPRVLAADGFTEIILHKRIPRQGQTNVEQSQSETAYWENTVPLNGANFSVFDATALYQEWLLTGKSINANGQLVSVAGSQGGQREFKAFAAHWNNLNRKKALEYANEHLDLVSGGLLETQTLRDSLGNEETGVARLRVPNTKNGQKAAYLLIETGFSDQKRANIEPQSAPMMLALPVKNGQNQTLSEVKLYPKDAGYQRDPYFYKFAKKLNGTEEPLAGAEFVFYREANGQKQYLMQDAQIRWKTSTDVLNDNAIQRFTSDKNGLVMTGSFRVPAGTYYFEEIKTVSGYGIDQQARAIEVIIPEDWNQSITVAGQEMEELVGGSIPESAQKEQRPRIYNTQISESQNNLPDTLGDVNDPYSSSTAAKPRGRLPSTGEAKMTISLIGVLIVTMILLIWKKKLSGGDGNEKTS